MAASFLHHIFNSDSPSRHDTDFSRQVPDVPPSTPQIHTPYPQSHSSSSSAVRHTAVPTSMMSLEPSAVPIDETLPESEVPRYQALSTSKPDSEPGKSRQKSELSTTSKARDYLIPSRNIYQPLTRHFCPTLVLQNTGSVARDHLASERTFLAYVRTSLGMASAGVALVQLFTMSSLPSNATGALPTRDQRVQKFAIPLGLTALVMALIVLLIGVSRFFLIQNALPENKFPAARISIAFISFGLGAVTVVAFGALFNGRVHA